MRTRAGRGDGPAGGGKAALLERFTAQMRATARRYSANGHDAEDAYQRAAEILLTHDPGGTDDELCRWLRTTVKHEALAIRRARDRIVLLGELERLPEPRRSEPDTEERAERLERLSLGAQALRRLKPQEIRCLTLRAEGYSYAEICERTGWTYTKVNRCLTEGRRAFLERVSGIESGAECERLAPLLSALADGEAPARDLAQARPHLKGCPACRRRLAQFRDAPARVAALAPAAAVTGGGGPARTWLESLLGAAQHKAAAAGERIHAAAELATGQKVAAVAASAAALAGGGVSAERAAEREPPAKRRAAEARPARPQPVAAAPAPAAQPPSTPTPPAPRPEPPSSTPDPAREFAPAAAAPAPSAPARAPGGGSPGGAEFGP